MSTQTTRPLSLLHVDFDELYARHLGRHSQFGINVAHVLALYGLWFGVYAAVDQAARHLGAPMTWPILAAMAATYLTVISLNAPLPKVLAAGLGSLLKPSPIRKKANHEHADDPAVELAAR